MHHEASMTACPMNGLRTCPASQVREQCGPAWAAHASIMVSGKCVRVPARWTARYTAVECRFLSRSEGYRHDGGVQARGG